MLQNHFTFSPVDDAGNPEEVMSEYYAKFRRGDMNLDDKLDESEFLYFEHPEHNPQSTKDLVEDMIENFDRNQDKVNCQQHGLILDWSDSTFPKSPWIVWESSQWQQW